MFKRIRKINFFLLSIVFVFLNGMGDVSAMDSTWTGGTGVYNVGGNWSAGVPSGQANRAIFSNVGVSAVTFSANAPTVGRVLFNLGAQAYTFALSRSLSLNGIAADAGIVNQSANQQTYNITGPAGRLRLQQNASIVGNVLINNNRFIRIRNNSSAGSATIVNTSSCLFRNNSTAGAANITNNGGELRFETTTRAGTATIVNNATLNFNNNSDAQSSQITNNGTINFNGNATAGSSAITNQVGGVVDFDNNTTADNATIVNNGTLNLTGITAPGIGIGSLSGSGNVVQGNNNPPLTIGNNLFNASTTISGIISGTGTSRIIKIGPNILTLSGVNTYTGGTTINAGTLSVDADNRLGNAAGGLTFGGGALQTTATFASARGVTLNAGGGTFNTDPGTTLTLTGAVGGAGALTKAVGNGTLVLSGVNTYMGGASINAGTLSIDADNRLGNAAGGLTFGGGTLQTTATFASARGVTLNAGGGTFNTDPGTTLTLSGVIGGGGPLAKVGNGNLTLSGANTYMGGTSINAGTLSVDADNRLGNAAGGLTFGGGILQTTAGFVSTRGITLNAGGGTFNTNPATVLAMNGNIVGVGTLTKSGAGTLILGGANTFVGDTTINAGTLIYTGDTSGLGGNIINNAALAFVQAANSSFNQVISGGGTVTKSGGGNLSLTGNNTYTGNTTINAGTLTFTGSTTGLGGNIINNSALVFNQAANSSFNQVISGGGTVTKTGGGTLTFTGANTYTGGTFINGGTLSVDADNRLGAAAGGLTFGGGTLQTTANIASNRSVTLNAGGGTFNTDLGTTLTLSGVIGGPTGLLTKEGPGILTLSGANTYGGTTTINNGGLVFTGDTSGLGGNIINNSQLAFVQVANSSFNQVISGGGTVTKSGVVTLSLTGANTYTGNTTINAGTLTFTGSTIGLGGNIINNSALVFNQAANSSFNQVISGGGTVTKSGAGTLTFMGVNTYTGGTTINGGTLSVDADNRLGNAAGALTFGGGALQTTATFASARGVTLNAGGGTFNTDPGTTLTLSGVIGGGGPLTKVGNGNLTLSGANTYGGSTTINGGTLTYMGDTSGLGGNIINNSDLVFSQAANSSFNQVISGGGTVTKAGAGNLTLAGANTYGGNTTINGGTLTFTGSTSGLGGNIINNSALVFNQAANSSFNQVISGGGTVTKSGAGNLTLAGANTYGGNTTINGGTLTFTGSTSGLGGNIINNSALVFNQAANSSFNQVISGGGTVTKSGAGTLTLAGANTYTGNTTINAGTLTYTGDTSGLGGNIINNSALVFNQATNSSFNQVISGGGTVTKTGGGTITFTGANTYAGATFINAGTLSVDADNRLGAAAGGLTFGGGTLQTTASFVSARGITLNAGGGTFNTNAGTFPAMNGNIVGVGTLTKSGAGTLILGGANTFAGDTTINAGTLIYTGDTSGLGGNIINNAALAFAQAANSSFNQVISGGGTVTKTGAGNLTLVGNNTYSGNTTINGGTLTYTGDTSGLGGNIINNSALVFNQAANSSFGQAISGIGTVTKTGGGSLTFTGANTYTGMTTVNQGTLFNNGSLVSAVTVNPGATYGGVGSSGNLINNGFVAPAGNAIGTLRVNGNYSGSGTLLIGLNNLVFDLLQVTGTANLTNGSLIVTGPTHFGSPIVYTLVTANGGVIGQFAQTQLPNNFVLNFLPTAVQLVVESLDISSFVQGGNAGIVANYLDAIMTRGTVSDDLQTVFDALAMAADQGGNALRKALNQISPDPYREIGYLTFDQTSMINQSINTHQQRILNSNIIQAFQPQASTSASFDQFAHHILNRSQRSGVKSLSPTNSSPQRQQRQMPALGASSPGGTNLPVRKVVQVGNSSAWIEPYGSVRKKSNSSPLVGNKSDTYGVSIGGDTLVAPKTYVGVLGGLVKTDFDWTQNRGDGHVKGYYGGVYGLWLSNTGIYVDGQVILGGERIRSKRNIRFQTINRRARESHSGFVVSPDIELGCLMTCQKAIIQPFLNFAYTAAYETSFTERGANSLNVHRPSKTSHFSRSELGSVFSYFFTCQDTLIYPSVQLSWVQKRHLGSHGKNVKFNLSGQNFGTTVHGDNRVRDMFSPGVGLTAQFKNGMYVTADVKGEFGSGERAGQFMVEAGFTF